MPKTAKRSRDKHGVKKFEIPEDIADLWGSTEPQENEFEDVPPDKYQVRIDSAEINKSKSSGRLQVSFQMTIAAGKYANRKIWKHDGLETDQNIAFFKGAVERLGLEVPDDIQELPEVLNELIGTFAQVTVKVKGEYTNVYFDKALDDDEVEVEELDEESNGHGKVSLKKGKKAGKKSRVSADDKDEEDETEEEEEDESEDEDSEEEEDSNEDDEEEEEEEGEDDEEEASSKKGKKLKGKSPKAKPSKSKDEDDEEEEEESGDEGVTVKFKRMADLEESRVIKLAEANEFDPDEYDDAVKLLVDVAEYLGVSGEFDNAKKLIVACKEKASA